MVVTFYFVCQTILGAGMRKPEKCLGLVVVAREKKKNAKRDDDGKEGGGASSRVTSG